MHTVRDLLQVLNLLNQFPKNPELMLLELRKEKHNMQILNLIYDTEINGHDICYWLEKYLKKQPEFADCDLKVKRHSVMVSLSDKYNIPLNRIFTIDIYSGEYSVDDSICDEINKVLNKTYTLHVKELSDFYKRFENFTWHSRIKIAKDAIKRGKLQDVLFAFTVSKKKVESVLSAENKRLAIINESEKKLYNRLIATQECYKENGVECIAYVQEKIKEISEWLDQKKFVKM